MNYTITVRAGNVLGISDSSIISARTSLSIPVGVPTSLHVNPNTNRIMWNEINCSQLSGRFIEYNVLIQNVYVNELVFGTEYNISVAAVNSVGRGPFSDPILVEIGATTSSSCNPCNDGAAIGLGIFVAILMILLAVSLAVNIYCFMKFIYPVIATKTNKSTTKEANKIDENIAMKECESYGVSEAVIYEECGDKVNKSTTDDKPVKPVVVDEPPAAVYEAFDTDDIIHDVDDIDIYEA
ncbi:PREDICTED: uncharacterized protein LOC109591299 [Amphimedon queenslandica]|uniref:Fibronectin type-III domain-containing protein n=1 Tax=Amphimedon queenslandica TaxID=400682 RepID=A0A1X7SVJ7_AMPQE|nr:PREDICTED: uncharacterized protein LOC109591299 [Amphimedon queenslandica]|eukprot:XP_019862619.1 PREDICTED: uncharacterized protein LOC109591299 [Amphimedon queenslandica]